MKVDWVNTPMYVTLMALAAGVGLLLVVGLGRAVYYRRPFSSDGYALAFLVVGGIQFLMGLHMSLTWPLARIAAYDNIIFGEPAVAFGAMLLAASLYLWRRGGEISAPVTDDGRDDAAHERLAAVRGVVLPVSVFAAAIGLACFAIAAAGWKYQLWAAPPQEPISGLFAPYPLVEATFIAMLYVLIGLGAVLLPVMLVRPSDRLAAVISACWVLAGLALTLFGALNYFTHIGLIINTT